MNSETVKELSEIYEVIKRPIHRDPESIQTTLTSLSVRLARSAEILADAQEALDKKRGDEAEKLAAEGYPPSVIKELLNSRCRIERKILMLAERLNSTIVHQIDVVRTLLSYEKEQMRQY